jgi:carbonic anhydrase/acetyltransferase-like protein (isoleucine patch superfamily)
LDQSDRGFDVLLEHDGQAPKIDPTCRIAPNATICGEVTIGPYTSVGFGAVLTAESGAIAVGANCVIMDTAVIRGVRRNPVTLGDNVLVGPRAYLTGCMVADNAFIATGAAVFNGARIGERAEVRVNGIVHLRTVLPADSVVPLSWIAIGDPVQILPPGRHEEIWAIQEALDFPGYVFGVSRPGPGKTFMPDVMPRYAQALLRHKNDETLS